jgi:hypothetical protein
MNRNEFLYKKSKKTEDYNRMLEEETLEERRSKYKWRFVLDDDKKMLENPILIKIENISTNGLREIIDDKDYNNISNEDIVLKTIWDEYHRRKSNG